SAVLAVVALAACTDNSFAPTEARQPIAQGSTELISEGEGIFQRYVAIGTSISMGVQSDGVYGATQQTSWPAQLARLAHRELSLPVIQAPGCSAPFSAPLATGQRTSGEGAGLDFLLRQCMPNEAGVVLPAGNVAIDGARIVPTAVGTGVFYREHGYGPYTLSCANSPAPVVDYILDATDVAAVNTQLAAMNAVIQDEAQTRGFAYFPLGALYEGAATKPAFNAISIMTTAQPYGPYI